MTNDEPACQSIPRELASGSTLGLLSLWAAAGRNDHGIYRCTFHPRSAPYSLPPQKPSLMPVHFARHLLVLLLLCCFAGHAHAQGSKEDYLRAENLEQLTRDKVDRNSVDPSWYAGGKRFWYRLNLPDNQSQFVSVDLAQGQKSPAFDHDRLATALAAASGQVCEGVRLPMHWLSFNDTSETMSFRAFDKGWTCTLASYEVQEADVPEPPQRRRRGRRGPGRDDNRPNHVSPDGKWEAVVKDYQLVLRDTTSQEEVPLTTDASADHFYEPQVYWSPDSTRLVALQTQRGDDRKVNIIESSPDDQLQPKLHSYDYLKPGDKIPLTKPRLFHVADKKQISVEDALFPNPWQIDRVRWQPDSQRFTFIYNQRGHQVLRVIVVDGNTGEVGTLIDEHSDTFIDYAGKQFAHFAEKTDEILWMSERDGWNHLYLYDARTGTVKNQITRGEWVVRRVDRVDEESRQIWFQAGGIYPEQDPYYVHYGRVNFDGSGLVLLTAGNGTHSVEFSPDRDYLVDTYSRVDMPPVAELRRAADGSLVCELERADMSALVATGWQVPERFAAKGRDGTTDIYGVIWRPTHFDAQKSYPIIENIYAGPQSSFTPKAFASYFRCQALAELGFIVVQMDGMGTSDRSKAFHDVCCRNLGDSGFPDRIAWIRAAAAKYPYMDLTRVGIFGGSAGGQSSTQGVLNHGDFYKVAVSDCGCHDNRMDKIWWNELWMGWPIGPHYAEQSNVTNAHKLQGKLLLIVGELDRNVDPASTMQVVNALIKADKDFEMLVVPGGGHGIAESKYGSRRRADFFVRHLLGVEPRHDP